MPRNAMVEVEWDEGDAQQHPFAEASFDRVLSAFGHMVCRPGGALGIVCWMPTGAIGRMVDVVGRLVPPPPGDESPMLWGTEEHVRELLGDARSSAARSNARLLVESYVDFMLESFGPLLNAQEALADRAGELRTEENLADDGTLRFQGDYLISVVSRP